MIGVEEKERIRRAYFVEHKSIRWIARNYHFSRTTVRKALGDASPPMYKRNEEPVSKVLGPFKPVIHRWLEEDKTKPKKQHHTGKRIFDRLKGECGFKGAQITLYKYLEKIRPSLKDVYVPIAYAPGIEGQVDFGEAWAYVAGKLTKVHLLCMQLCYSTARFARAYPTERQEAFLDGMQEGFYYFEGVPRRMTFDNPKTLVKKLYRGHRRDEQKNFIVFRSHFMFEGHFCNTQCPNEKGHVEGLVGVIRRNVFVPVPQVESIEELNGPILNWCHKDLDRSHPDGEGTVKDYLDKEKERLFPLPKRRYLCCRTHEAIVNKFSEVRFDYNLYSVPIKYAHKYVTIKGYVDKVKIVKDDGIIAEHRRSYARNQEILEPLHYIPILKRKPHVLKHGKPFKDWRLPRIFEEYRRILKEREDRPEKEYIRLLLLHEDYTTKEIAQALSRAITFGSLSVDAVRIFLNYKEDNPSGERLDTRAWPEFNAIKVKAPDIKGFNRLLEVEEVSVR